MTNFRAFTARDVKRAMHQVFGKNLNLELLAVASEGIDEFWTNTMNYLTDSARLDGSRAIDVYDIEKLLEGFVSGFKVLTSEGLVTLTTSRNHWKAWPGLTCPLPNETSFNSATRARFCLTEKIPREILLSTTWLAQQPVLICIYQ